MAYIDKGLASGDTGTTNNFMKLQIHMPLWSAGGPRLVVPVANKVNRGNLLNRQTIGRFFSRKKA